MLPFLTTWMKLEGIMVNIKVRETQILHDVTYMCNLNKIHQIYRKRSHMWLPEIQVRARGIEGRWAEGTHFWL